MDDDTSTERICEIFSSSPEVAQLSHSIAKTFFPKENVFLRELLSNSNDALNRVDFEISKNSSNLKLSNDLNVAIVINRSDRTLAVIDNGIGMTRTDLIHSLGSINKPETKSYMDALNCGSDTLDLERFGLGWFSIHQVTEKFVISSKHNDDLQYEAVSYPDGTFIVRPDNGDQMERGTKVLLYLTESKQEYLQKERLMELIKDKSFLNRYPWKLIEEIEGVMNVIEEVNKKQERRVKSTSLDFPSREYFPPAYLFQEQSSQAYLSADRYATGFLDDFEYPSSFQPFHFEDDYGIAGVYDSKKSPALPSTQSNVLAALDSKSRSPKDSGVTKNSSSSDEEEIKWLCRHCNRENEDNYLTCPKCKTVRCDQDDILQPPLSWKVVEKNQIVKKTEVKKKEADHQRISKIMSTCHPSSPSVLKSLRKFFTGSAGKQQNVELLRLERIENVEQFQAFTLKKNQVMERNDMDESECVSWLYHGTNAEAAERIIRYNFNRSFCGKHGTMYGRGVYFATDPSYSASTQYAPADGNGVQYMFLSQVITGRYTAGQPIFLEPPALLHGEGRFDCVVDSMQNPQIYVIFQDCQAYPYFLIAFRTIEG